LVEIFCLRCKILALYITDSIDLALLSVTDLSNVFTQVGIASLSKIVENSLKKVVTIK
jgi:hypothetical protein